METPTPFELNQAIQHWRENLSQSPAFRGENLDELEAHLRDSIVSLQTRGLSEDEAFHIAAKRLGSESVLSSEFRKTNFTAIWRHRALWMLVGMLFWSAGADVISIIKSVAVYAGSWITMNGLLLGWLSGGLHLLSFAAVIAIFGLLANGRITQLNHVGAKVSARPALFIAGAVGCMLVLEISSGLLLALTFKQLAPTALGQRFLVEQWFASVIPVLKSIAVIWGIVWLRRQQIGRSSTSRFASGALLTIAVIGLSLSPTAAQEHGSTNHVVTPKPASATMDEAMKLWRDGKQSEAVEKFQAVDFSKRPLFPTGSVLNMTEVEFMSLPQTARDKMSKVMMDDIQTIKLIAGRVNETTKAALAAKDQTKADQCISQLKAAGEAFDRPSGLALLKLVGQALKKMAAESPALSQP